MSDLPERAIRRTRSYWYIDGLAEINFGFLLILLGLKFFVQTSTPPGSKLENLLNYGFLVIVIGFVFTTSWLVRVAKERFTYPRTGFISYRRKPMDLRAWVFTVLIALASILVGSVLYALFQVWQSALDWLPIFQGFFGVAIFLPLAYLNGLRRFYLLAAFSALLGILFALVEVTGWSLMVLYYGLFGGGLVVSGGITLWTYMTQTSTTQEESNEP